MKLAAFLLALLALSSALRDKEKLRSDKNQEKRIHGSPPKRWASTPLTSAVSKKNRTSWPPSFGSRNPPLRWIYSNGHVPGGAVRIYNSHAHRFDFVCRYRCYTGFYNPNLGRHCHYPFGGRERLGTPFQILVHADRSKVWTWKSGSGGAVPISSVRSCPSGGFYVGKNLYGVGTVSVGGKGIFIPLKGYARWFHSYEVLTVN